MVVMRFGVVGALALVLACGEDDPDISHIDTAKALSDLTADERSHLCDWHADWTEEDTVCDQFTAERKSRSECLHELESYYALCSANVAGYLACFEAIRDAPCTLDWDECTALQDSCPGGD